MQEELKKLSGVTVYPSETNFILVHYDQAKELNALFEAKGIGVRHFGDAPGSGTACASRWAAARRMIPGTAISRHLRREEHEYPHGDG